MKFLSAIGVILFVALVGFLLAFPSFANEQTRACSVTHVDRVNTGSGSDMRIYTEDCDVMRVQDLAFRGQFNSASIFGQIQPGSRYEFTTVGWRIPFMSTFPSIVGVPQLLPN